jgi:hypothetical protein
MDCELEGVAVCENAADADADDVDLEQKKLD